MMDKPAKADPLIEARKKAQEEEEAAAKAEEEELKQKTADILRGPKAAAKSLAKSAAMIAADPMGANPEAAAEVVERGAEYLGKGYDYLKEKISPEEVAGPAAAIAAFDPELFRGSKITTETGEPLTLYHGTRTSRGFDEFDLERIGQSTDSGWLGRGIYFNTNPKTAAYYAGSGVAPTGLDEIVDTRGFAPVGERGSILRATASIKNPYEWGPKTNAIYGLMTQGQRLPDDIHDAVIRRAGYTPSLVEMGNLNPEWSNSPESMPDNYQHGPSGWAREDRGPARKKAAQKLSQALQDELTSRGYDGVRATLPRYEKGKLVGTDYEVVAFRPEQVRQAPRAAAPVESLFSDRALDRARTYSYPSHKSKDLLVYLTPEEFLGLAEQGHSPEKESRVRSMVEAGEKFEDVPHLRMDDSGQVLSHEGRHRVQELQRLGYDRIPVLLESRGIRWSEQAEGGKERLDYVKELPKQLTGEGGTFKVDSPFHTEGELRGQPLESRGNPRAAAPETPRAPEGWDRPRPFEINHKQGVGTDHWGNKVYLDYIDEVDIEGTRSTMRPVYYHVTLSENVTDIVNDGIRVGEGQNWQRATGEAHGAGRVHTFADYESARRWAHKMETAMFGDQVFSSPKGEVAIIAHSGGTWQTDPSVSPFEGGSALQKSEAVPPEQVIGYESYDRDQRGQRGPEIAWDSVDGRFDIADKRYRRADVERTLAPVATINAAMDEIRAPGSDHGDTIKRLGRGQLNDAQVQEVFDRWQRWALKERKLPSKITAIDLIGILEEVRDAPETPRTSRPKRGGQGTVGTIGGIAGLGISGVLAAQAAKGAVPEEVRDAGVEAFYRFKGGKPVEARELDPKSKAVQAFVENEEALQWALQNNRISEDAYRTLSNMRDN